MNDVQIQGIEHDPQADAIYVRLAPAERGGETRDLGHGRYVDYGPDGRPLGVELLFVSRGVDVAGLPAADEIATVLRRRGIRVLQAAS